MANTQYYCIYDELEIISPLDWNDVRNGTSIVVRNPINGDLMKTESYITGHGNHVWDIDNYPVRVFDETGEFIGGYTLRYGTTGREHISEHPNNTTTRDKESKQTITDPTFGIFN